VDSVALRFDPASYPGWRPAGPSLVYDGAVHPVRVDGDSDRPVTGAVAAPVLAHAATNSIGLVAAAFVRSEVAQGST
jgi:hypothetical protein